MVDFTQHRRRSPDTPHRAYEDIEADLTNLIFRGVVPTIIVSMCGVVGAAGILAYRFHDDYLWTLASLSLCVCSLRLAIPVAFQTSVRSGLAPKTAFRWELAYSVTTFVYCCTIAATALYECRAFGTAGTALCTIGVFCICIGLSSRVGMRPFVVRACGLVMLSSLGFSIWRSAQSLYGVSLLLIAFFTYQFCFAAGNQFRIVVEQLRSRQMLRTLSEQDALTGLANRRHFEMSLAQLCAAGLPFAILYIDLDRFKRVNDNFGHATGDTLLIQVAERLGQTIRHSDLLARLGGDEFAILQSPLIDANSASALALRINQDIGQAFRIGGHDISIGASVGIRLSGGGSADPEALLHKADQALYHVKQSGGGSFSLAEA